MELKRVGPWSVARVCGPMYAAMGLIVGVLFACISLVGGMISPRDSNTAAFGWGRRRRDCPVPDRLRRARAGVRRGDRLGIQRLRRYGRRHRSATGIDPGFAD